MDPVSMLMAIPAFGPFIPYVTLAITVASLVSVALPAPKSPTGVYAQVFGAVHWVALLKGHAVAASAVAPAAPPKA